MCVGGPVALTALPYKLTLNHLFVCIRLDYITCIAIHSLWVI